jgi:hypothetical protein
MLTGITFLDIIKKQKERSSRRQIALTHKPKIDLHQTCLLERPKGAIFCHRFQSPGRKSYHHESVQFRNPNAFRLQIRQEQSRSIRGHVATDAPLFLGHAAPVNHVTPCGLGSGDGAFSSHSQVLSMKSPEDVRLQSPRQV